MARLIIAGVFMGLISASMARDFYVGGKDGWVLSPSESYSSWSGRYRFQVNDRLVFKYKKGEDSVLVVKKEDYDSCNVSNPIQKLDGGDSVFKFDRSGPFYFISGVPGRCSNGQKLFVRVLSVKNKKPIPPSTSPAPSPAPPLTPPASSPSSAPPHSSTPVSSPVSSPSPSSTPVSSPVSSPSPSSTPVSSPVPSSSPSSSPVSAPSPSSSPVPTTSPSSGPSSTPAPSPGASCSPSAGPGASPGQSPTSANGTGAPGTSPSSPPSSATTLTVSSFLIGLLGLVLGNTILN